MASNNVNEYLERDIYQAEQIITRIGRNYVPISSKELITYFSEPVPSGDDTSIEDLIDNQWLLIHELVELSELKKMGLSITADIFRTHSEEVEEAHFHATVFELRLAKQQNNDDWINLRLKDIQNWLNDPQLDEIFKTKYRDFVKEITISN